MFFVLKRRSLSDDLNVRVGTYGMRSWFIYDGASPCRDFHVSRRILNWILWRMGNQWSTWELGVMWSYLWVFESTWAAAFCVRWSLSRRVFEIPYKGAYPLSSREVMRAWIRIEAVSSDKTFLIWANIYKFESMQMDMLLTFIYHFRLQIMLWGMRTINSTSTKASQNSKMSRTDTTSYMKKTCIHVKRSTQYTPWWPPMAGTWGCHWVQKGHPMRKSLTIS